MTPDEQRQYICETVKKLTQNDINSAFALLYSKVDETMFNVHSNATSINLDRVQDEIVKMLYDLVVKLYTEP